MKAEYVSKWPVRAIGVKLKHHWLNMPMNDCVHFLKQEGSKGCIHVRACGPNIETIFP